MISGRSQPFSSRKAELCATVSLSGLIIEPVAHRQAFGFVHAHEALFPTDTPQEAFVFASDLLMSTKSKTDREEKVDSTVRFLRLGDCRDTYIGSASLKGVSSGEKKRAAVGLELIAERDIVFLDEPTTGLDSETAFELISLLRETVVSRGVCMVAVIHQPSGKVFDLFDNVVFLARGGRIVYHGPVHAVSEYFASQGYVCPLDHNPSDYIMFLMQTLGDGAIDDLVTSNMVSMNEQQQLRIDQLRSDPRISEVPEKNEHAPWPKQFALLVAREYKATMRDLSIVLFRVLTALLFGLIIAFLFFQVGTNPGGAFDQNHVGLVFVLGTFALVSAGQSLLIAYAQERPIMLREVAAGLYHPVTYSVSKDVLEYPVIITCILIYLTLAYLIGGLQGSFLLLLLGMGLIGLSAAAISFFFASVITSVEVAAIIGAYLLVIEIIFSGFFVVSSQIPAVLRWIQYINPLKYGLSIMIIAEFNNLPGSEALFARDDVFPGFLLGYIFILVAITLLFRIAGTLALWLRARKSVA